MFYCEGNDCKALSEPERKFNAACEDLNLHWARVGIAAKLILRGPCPAEGRIYLEAGIKRNHIEVDQIDV